MKKILYLLILFNLSLKAQSGIVTYRVTMNLEKDSELLDKIRDEMQLMEFTLTYDVNSSYFQSEKYIPKDQLGSKLAKSILSANGSYMQKGRNTYSEATVSNKNYLIDESDKMQDWELTNETATINNYLCYKAIHKEINDRSSKTEYIIAWYTLSIPASYGPLGYGGLPGLILQLDYKQSTIIVNKITLNSKKIKVPILKSEKIITNAEYVKLMRNQRKVTPD